MTHLELMQYFDGELGPDEVAAVERRLVDDPAARDALEGLAQLSEVLASYADARAEQAGDIADLVFARLDREAAAAPAPVTARPVPRRRSVLPWVWAGAAALAAAAVVALIWRTPWPEPGSARALGPVPDRSMGTVLAARPVPRPSVGATPLRAAPDGSPGVSIEAVDFGSRNGTIFMVPTGEDATTPVVWVMDPPDGTANPVKPL